MMCMRICKCGWQTGGRKISLVTVFQLQNNYTTLNKPQSVVKRRLLKITAWAIYNKFVKLREVLIYSNNRLHSGMTFSELVH